MPNMQGQLMSVLFGSFTAEMQKSQPNQSRQTWSIPRKIQQSICMRSLWILCLLKSKSARASSVAPWEMRSWSQTLQARPLRSFMWDCSSLLPPSPWVQLVSEMPLLWGTPFPRWHVDTWRKRTFRSYDFFWVNRRCMNRHAMEVAVLYWYSWIEIHNRA